MDAPPIPRFVDLVHMFKGVVVEQLRKRVEKLLSDSILLWRLLKLLFKILQWRSWVGSSRFWFPRVSFYSKLFVSPVILRSIVLWFFFPMESDEDNTPHQQQEEGEPDTSGKKECLRSPTLCFLSQTPVRRHKDVRFSASCLNFNANWRNSNWKQKTTREDQTLQKTLSK